MEVKALAIFIDVIRKGSFAAVARDREVDPATISRTINGLERELHFRLFQRTTRKIVPTEAAMVYFKTVEPLVEELITAQVAATDVHETPKGMLRISSPVSFAELNIVPLLPEFAARYPELSYELILSDADLDLIAEHIDVAIRVGPLQESRLISTKLCPMVTRVCATPEYLHRFGQPKSPTDLKNHNCLVLGYRGFHRNQWRFISKNTHKVDTVQVNEYLRTSNAMALKMCAMAGMGITLQARWMIGRELKEESLTDLFPQYHVSAALSDPAAWILYPSRNFVPRKVRVFLDYLKDKFKNGPPWDA